MIWEMRGVQAPPPINKLLIQNVVVDLLKLT